MPSRAGNERNDMIAEKISPCITTDKIEETKDFYEKYFRAETVFDCGWYVDLRIGSGSSEIQFMSPQTPDQPLFDGKGLVYNFAVEDVDEEYEKLIGLGLKPVMPLEDHPWGDRGFAVPDPNGIILYIYTETEPSEEFKQYFR
jgi:uncharacterized glyoxalase superfamily protein PhnB